MPGSQLRAKIFGAGIKKKREDENSRGKKTLWREYPESRAASPLLSKSLILLPSPHIVPSSAASPPHHSATATHRSATAPPPLPSPRPPLPTAPPASPNGSALCRILLYRPTAGVRGGKVDFDEERRRRIRRGAPNHRGRRPPRQQRSGKGGVRVGAPTYCSRSHGPKTLARKLKIRKKEEAQLRIRPPRARLWWMMSEATPGGLERTELVALGDVVFRQATVA